MQTVIPHNRLMLILLYGSASVKCLCNEFSSILAFSVPGSPGISNLTDWLLSAAHKRCENKPHFKPQSHSYNHVIIYFTEQNEYTGGILGYTLYLYIIRFCTVHISLKIVEWQYFNAWFWLFLFKREEKKYSPTSSVILLLSSCEIYIPMPDGVSVIKVITLKSIREKWK